MTTDETIEAKIDRFKGLVHEHILERHEINTRKCTDPSEFNINQFLLPYLANFLTGRSDYKSLAKALVYPRVLGTSITTTFGNSFQTVLTEAFNEIEGSTTPGIDIEFTDKIDGRKKYVQLKAGPNVINKDDVKTIGDHFDSLKNLARTNNLDVRVGDMVFCLLYGERSEFNANILKLEEEYEVMAAEEFWYHLTGYEDFYNKLIKAMAEVAEEVDMKEVVEDVIDKLAKNLEREYGDRYAEAELEE